jgi:hypothetical protein
VSVRVCLVGACVRVCVCAYLFACMCACVCMFVRVCVCVCVRQATGFTPLCLAVHKAQPGLVRALTRGRANANHVPRGGLPPLCSAATEGHKGICEALIQGGATVNFTTPVRWAHAATAWLESAFQWQCGRPARCSTQLCGCQRTAEAGTRNVVTGEGERGEW